MEVFSNIVLNLQAPAFATVFSPQGQTLSRSIQATLMDGATPWEIPSTALCIIRYAKPDGTKGFYDTLEDDSSAYSYNGNVVTFGLATQALTVPGTVLMQLDFYNSDGEKLSTFTFRLIVAEGVFADSDITSSDYFNVLTGKLTEAAEIFQQIKAAYGAPLTANTAADMTDTSRVYVYTGTTTDTLTNGHWYYWNGSAWADGGNYNSTGFQTDTSLSVAGAAADAKATGDAIGEVNRQLSDVIDRGLVNFDISLFANGTINTSGDYDSSFIARIAMPTINVASYAITLNIASGFAVIYATYDSDGNKLTREPGITNTLIIQQGTRYRIAIYKSSGEVLSQKADIDEFVSKVTYSPLLTQRIEALEANGSVTTNKIADRAVTTDKVAEKIITPEKTTFVIHDDTTNFINKWLNGNNYIRDGVIVPTTEPLFATDIILLDDTKSYYYGSLYSGYYAFYSADGTVLESHRANDPAPNPFTPPTGTAYARFTAYTETQKNGAWISTTNIQPPPYSMMLEGVDTNQVSNPCDFKTPYINTFNKCLCIGDSTTYGVFNHNEGGSTEYASDPNKAYPIKLQKMTGIECTNAGLASATFDEWYAQKSSVITSGYDMAIIQLGINDRFRYQGWTNTAKTALSNIVADLKSNNNGIKIFVATIIPALGFKGPIFDEISQGIRDAVAELNDSNVVLVDLAKYGHTADSEGFNVGHLSELGYTQLAMDYRGYISWLMSRNMIAYRNIQFIGTTYYYS